jgi:AAA domain
MSEQPAFLRKFAAVRDREHGGWLATCPICNEPGFPIIVMHNEVDGRYTLECLGYCPENRIMRAFGITDDEIRMNGASPAVIPFTLITMRSIEWFEKPLWQRSAFHLLAGPKGTGKGTYLAGLAARVSNSGGNVLLIASEDSAEIDIKPRLHAADADMSRCYSIQRHVRLPDDIDALREIAEGIGGVSLLVIDPVANHIGDKNTHSDGEVRDAIQGLNPLADRLGCLLIGVRHVGKDRTKGALASILGSTAWVDTPRAVVMVAKDNDDEMSRHIQVVAGNRSASGTGQRFRIDLVAVADLKEPITLAVPLGESDKNMDDLLNPSGSKQQRVSSDQLQALILEQLASGDKTRHELDAVAKAELGANPDSVYKSGIAPLREAARIRAHKDGTTGPWVYSFADAL